MPWAPPAVSLSILAVSSPSHLHSAYVLGSAERLAILTCPASVMWPPPAGVASIRPFFKPQLKDHCHLEDFPDLLCPRVGLTVLLFVPPVPVGISPIIVAMFGDRYERC